MISFQDAIEPYREPTTRAIGLRPNPPDWSEDNPIVFALTYLMVQRNLPGGENINDGILTDLLFMLESKEKGVFLRRPGDSQPASWDDHICAAMGHSTAARQILEHGVETDWMFGDNWLARIPIFVPTVKYCAGVSLSILSQVQVAAVFIANCFEKREETSGKCLLYLVSMTMNRSTSWIIQPALAIWRWRMTKLYGSPKGLYAIYFQPSNGVPHPFSVYAADNF